jgi:zinc protease
VSVALHCGTAFEDAARNGVTGLVQRSMVKGTKTRESDRIAHESEFFGASIAPLYGHDVSGFSFSTVERFFRPALDVFADIVQNPTFPEAEIERERSLVLAEIAQVEDEPFEKAGLELQKAIFGDDPYGLPVSGEAPSVTAITRADLITWYERFYAAENLLFSVVGDVERDAAVAALEAAFLGLRRRAASPPPRASGAPVAVPPREVIIEKDVQQEVILLGVQGPPMISEERYALALLTNVMSGMGNRLFVELRDKKSLCYYTGMFYRPMRRAGVIGAYIGTSPEKEAAAREGLLGELARLVDKGVTAAELGRAQNAMLGHFAIGRQTNAAEAGLAVRNELLGLGFDEVDRFEERVLSVTRDEVQRVAERWIGLDRFTVTIVRPSKS